MELKVEAAGIGSALLTFIKGDIQPAQPFIDPKMQQQEARKEAIRRMTGLSQDEMTALERGDVLHKEIAQKLDTWRRRWLPEKDDGNEGQRAQAIAEMLNAAGRPLPPNLQPHWQIALDRKVEAMGRLDKLVKADGGVLQLGHGLLHDMEEDLSVLKLADVYSFNADTMHAIQEGAKTISHESTLKSVEIPTVRAGWFWFADPFPVASSPNSSDNTHAMLWSWGRDFKVPTLRFSCYVVTEKVPYNSDLRNTIYPSTIWLWPMDLNFHEMLAFNRQLYKDSYGPGSPDSPGKEAAVGEEPTLLVVAEMSLFFLMACLWFRQTVPGNPKKKIEPKLTQTPGHIERHARKRYEKAFKTTPTVHVIALRKSAVERVESGEGTGSKLKVRFVVRGHAKLQPCGPGRADRKLIWIDPFVKGPEDAPFKESGPRVFAVIR